MLLASLPRAPARPCVLAIALLSAFAAGAAQADPSAALDRFSVAAGAFYAKPKVYADGDTAYGYVQTPDARGAHATLPRVRADLLIGDSQGLSFDYYRYDKGYDPVLSGATTYQGQPITGNATVHGNLRLELAQLAYRWWLGHQQDAFGIGVGAAYLRAQVDGTIDGQVSSASGALQTTSNFSGAGSTGDSAYAPLVELGWRHAFQPDLRLVAEVAGVKKNGGHVDGHIYNGTLGLEWFPARNVGVAFDYGIQKVALQRHGDRRADLDLRLTGPSAYVKLRF